MASARWRRAAAVAAGNLLLITVLLEAGARVVYPWMRGGEFSWPELREDLRRPDRTEGVVAGDPAATAPGVPALILHPYLGYVFEPGMATKTREGAELRYSRFGFYGDDPVFTKSPGEVIVAIGGGSVAAGLWHRGGETLRSVLQSDPRYQGKTIRFECFALGGFKQPQPLHTLAYLLSLGAQFDIWIELDGFNELALPLAQNAPAGVPVMYPRDWQNLARSGASARELRLRAEMYTHLRNRERLRSIAAHVPFVYSAFLVACWDAADRRSAARIGVIATQISEAEKSQSAVRYTEDAVLHESVEIWKNASIQMARLCAANGIDYYQFIQPNQYFPGTKTFSEEEKRTAIAVGGYRPPAEKGYPLLLRAGEELRAQDLPVFDLTAIFRDEPRTLYRDTCCHLNELGNELLARRIAELILSQPAAPR